MTKVTDFITPNPPQVPLDDSPSSKKCNEKYEVMEGDIWMVRPTRGLSENFSYVYIYTISEWLHGPNEFQIFLRYNREGKKCYFECDIKTFLSMAYKRLNGQTNDGGPE